MEDVLRCEGVPETGEMVFCRLVEYLRKENCLRAYEAICDALYEGALNEYDNGFDRSVILSILEGNDHPKANHILSALEGSISDKHTELIEKYGKSHGYIKNT
ncbi:MAG: hypothetical protein COA99_19745 [Moraxellaceae bacterium]|nr:MAG: hypothetical protein COA99_19745 [Moraxellaceae bacterium]